MFDKVIKVFLFLLFSVMSLISQERWQQGINYRIEAHLDVETNIIEGIEIINYKNNSPDTLKEIYIHLYYNAFKPGSYMNIKSFYVNRDNGKRISNLAPEDQGDLKIIHIMADGTKVISEEYDTIFKLTFDKPILPKDTINIFINFVSQVPKLIRRTGHDNSQGIRYSMAQWYPKVCEYDNEGWHFDEYVGREFYGVWGKFDVKITLDANYVVGATGIIQNPEEVKCGYELGKIDTIIIKDQNERIIGKTKTWHFIAENVHDFAWVADDKYIHDITSWNDVIIHSFYLPAYRAQWKPVKYYARDMLEFYSENFGLYQYKQFTVAQAGDGGMEYPNIIFNAGYSPGLVAHEGGHQWFYGMLANNESREAWLDEGFVTYSTSKMLYEKYRFPKFFTPEGISNIFQPPSDIKGDFRYYWTIANLGIEEPVLTHSDYFKDDMVYGFETYTKGGMILTMLENVIGENAFGKAMKEYFNKFHFKHPTTLDFQRILEKESGMELDWFFDEWLRTTKTCDYSISNFSGKWDTLNGKKFYNVSCELKNNDEIIMPIDLLVKYKNGKSQKMNIPLKWKAKEEKNSIILPRWDWVSNNYFFNYYFDDEVSSIEIDPLQKLPDLNKLNNKTGFLPDLDIHFIRPVQLNPPIEAYWINIFPSLWYSIMDGIKPGVYFKGGYMGNDLIPPDYAGRLGIWYCSKNNQVDFELGYSSSVSGLGKTVYFNSTFAKVNGIRNIILEMSKNFEPYHPAYSSEKKIGIKFEHSKLIEDDYPFYNLQWQRGNLNTLSLSYIIKDYSYGALSINFNSEISYNSIIDYSKFSFELIKFNPFGFPIKYRTFAGYSSNLPPIQKQFNLTSASADEQYKSTFYSSILGLNKKFPSEVNLGLEGGGNIRGYLFEYNNYSGKNIISINLESDIIYPFSIIGFNIPVLSKIKASLFLDAGNIWNSPYENIKDFFNDIRMDGGFSFELAPFENSQTAKYAFPFLNDLIIKLNTPVWLTHPKEGEKKFNWNWNITIGKAITI